MFGKKKKDNEQLPENVLKEAIPINEIDFSEDDEIIELPEEKVQDPVKEENKAEEKETENKTEQEEIVEEVDPASIYIPDLFSDYIAELESLVLHLSEEVNLLKKGVDDLKKKVDGI